MPEGERVAEGQDQWTLAQGPFAPPSRNAEAVLVDLHGDREVRREALDAAKAGHVPVTENRIESPRLTDPVVGPDLELVVGVGSAEGDDAEI